MYSPLKLVPSPWPTSFSNLLKSQVHVRTRWSARELKDALSQDRVVVFIVAEWEESCRLVYNRLRTLREEEPTAQMLVVDCDKLSTDARPLLTFKLVPTVVVYRNGNEVRRWEGVKAVTNDKTFDESVLTV